MGGGEQALTELRCALRFDRSTRELLLDAELFAETEHGRESQVLALSRPVWQDLRRPEREEETGAMGRVLAAWLDGRAPEEQRDPRHLLERPIAGAWGSFVGHLLARGIGRDTLTTVIEGSAHLRVVFEIGDRLVDRIPFETILWPPNANEKPLISRAGVTFVRTRALPSTGPLPPLGGREPGAYTILLALTENVASHWRERDLLERHPGPSSSGPALGDLAQPETHEFASTRREDTLADRMREVAPDLVVVSGHGVFTAQEQAAHLDLGGELVPGRDLAAMLRPRPAVVVLAMCGSANSGIEEPSLAAVVADAGVPIVLGFQGATTLMRPTIAFVTTFLERLAQPLQELTASGAGDLSLETIESALEFALRDDVFPVVFVHPNLLAGRTSRMVPVTRRVQAGLDGKRLVTTATPWYVPGQIAVWSNGNRNLRVPLPVDVGRTVEVALSDDGECKAIDLSFGSNVVLELVKAWSLDCSITVTARGDPVPPHWAARSAELGAVVRAIAFLLRLSPTADVIKMLNREVAADWGAHDAAPRAIDVESGARCGRFRAFPALTVHPAVRAERLLNPPPVRALEATLINEALSPDPAAFDRLLRGQWERPRSVGYPSLAGVSEGANGRVLLVGRSASRAEAADVLR